MRIERSRNPDFITKSKAILKTKEAQSQKQDSNPDFQIESINTNNSFHLKKKLVSKFRVVRFLEEKGIINSIMIFTFITIVVYIVNLEIAFQIFVNWSLSFLNLWEISFYILVAWFLPFMLFLRPHFYGKRLLIDPLTRNESLVLIGTGGIWVVLLFLYYLLITMPALLVSLLIPFKALEDNLDDINVISCNICKEKVGVFFEGKIAECPNCNHTIEYNLISKIAKLIGQLFLSLILSYFLLLLILTVFSILI